MKTVGERIRQARVHRGLSGEELAAKVGYKTQSGIANLENRAATSGGHKLAKIAEALNYSVGWFLNGPDVNDMDLVPPYDSTAGVKLSTWPTQAPQPPLRAMSPARHPEDLELIKRTIAIVDSLSTEGLIRAAELLEMLAEKYPYQASIGAGLSVPASKAA